MKHISLFVLIAVLGGIFVNEPLRSGDELELVAIVRADYGLEDISVKAVIYDLGIILSSNSFDLGKYENGVARIYYTNPLPAGLYLVRVVASNEKVRDVRHVYLRVV